jgi:hypothetical protein
VEIKIEWIKRKQMMHENTYRDGTGRGVVLAKKQFLPTVSFSASAREFSSEFFAIIKGRRTNPSY